MSKNNIVRTKKFYILGTSALKWFNMAVLGAFITIANAPVLLAALALSFNLKLQLSSTYFA